MANMEAYFDGIKKNEPKMQPIQQVLNLPMMQSPIYMKYPYVEAPTATMIYGLRYDYRKPSELYNYFDSNDFVEDAKLIKRWADKGFWSRSALSVGTPEDALSNGKVAARLDGMNAVKWINEVSVVQKLHPDWEIGYVPYVGANKLVHPVHPVHNGFSIPRSSKNAERALMFYEKLVTDKRYNFLTEYGIEGKHYQVTADGKYEMLGTPTSNGFQREAMNGWAWRNPQIQIFDANFTAAFDLFKSYDKISTPNINAGFAEDVTPYQAEAAAYNQVFTQYGLPIYYGLAGDPEVAVKRFVAKAKQAGWEKINAEFTKQWQAYCKEQGLN
jgi:putative aldouronate transport system substrate-binding protein